MSFTEQESGFQAVSIDQKMCSIEKSEIIEIKAYTEDLATIDERRISFSTASGEIKIFSEEEPGWEALLSWVTSWASLPEGWVSSAFPEAFSRKVTTIWQSNTYKLD